MDQGLADPKALPLSAMPGTSMRTTNELEGIEGCGSPSTDVDVSVATGDRGHETPEGALQSRLSPALPSFCVRRKACFKPTRKRAKHELYLGKETKAMGWNVPSREAVWGMETRASRSMRGGESRPKRRPRMRKWGDVQETCGSWGVATKTRSLNLEIENKREGYRTHPPYVEGSARTIEVFCGVCLRDAPLLENQADVSLVSRVENDNL